MLLENIYFKVLKERGIYKKNSYLLFERQSGGGRGRREKGTEQVEKEILWLSPQRATTCEAGPG